jgi:hypothetical protein
MTLHIRIDDEPLNSKAKFACGIGWPLPTGDVYFFDSEAHRAGCYLSGRPECEACPGCFPNGRPRFGTPISELSGRPGHKGYAEFCRIAESWGYP